MVGNPSAEAELLVAAASVLRFVSATLGARAGVFPGPFRRWLHYHSNDRHSDQALLRRTAEPYAVMQYLHGAWQCLR